MRLKIIINCLIFVFITLIILLYSSHFVPKTNENSAANIIENIYNMKSNSIDVLIVGPSTSRYGYNSLVAWNRYGITTLNCSFGYLSGPIVKNILIECLKRQKPKVILINIDAFLYPNKGVFIGNPHKGFINLAYNIFPEIHWSLNKLAILNKLTKYYKFNTVEFCNFLFPILSTNKISFNYILNNKKKLYLAPKNNSFFDKKDSSFNIGIHDIQRYYIYKIYTPESLKDLFKFCKTLDTPVLFLGVTHPIMFTKPYKTTNPLHEMFFQFLKEHNFEYIHINDHYNVKNLKFSYQDCYDEIHLNYWGSEKYTKYIAKILVDKYNLKDKRNNPEYYFWNEAAKEYINYVKEKFNIDIFL